MKISDFTFIERDHTSSFRTYRLFNDRLVLTFGAVKWLINFWLKHPHREPPYICGGFGFWRISFSVHFDFWFDMDAR